MKYIWFVIFTLSALTAFGQKSARVRQLEEQRKKALAEVEMTNQLLQETTQTAQNTLNRLNLLSQQIPCDEPFARTCTSISIGKGCPSATRKSE